MKNSIRLVSTVFACAAGLAVASSSIAANTEMLGDPSVPSAASRVITIKPDTRWINVARDETVTLVNASNGQSFAWHFDTPVNVLDLAGVAPADVLNGRHITAYVGESEVHDVTTD